MLLTCLDDAVVLHPFFYILLLNKCEIFLNISKSRDFRVFFPTLFILACGQTLSAFEMAQFAEVRSVPVQSVLSVQYVTGKYHTLALFTEDTFIHI